MSDVKKRIREARNSEAVLAFDADRALSAPNQQRSGRRDMSRPLRPQVRIRIELSTDAGTHEEDWHTTTIEEDGPDQTSWAVRETLDRMISGLLISHGFVLDGGDEE